MISIRKTATELDRLEQLNRAALACYRQAIESTATNAIEMDHSQLAQFCSELHRLSQIVAAATAPHQLCEVQTSFDARLQVYCDNLREQIHRLRSDLAAAAVALDAFTNSVASNTSDLDQDIKRQLERLKKTAHASQDLIEIRTEVDSTVDRIQAGVQRLQAANQLAMAQMKDEIRLLHDELKAAHAARHTADSPEPPLTIRTLAARDKHFSVVLAVVQNVNGLRTFYAPNLIESALCSFKERLKSLLPDSLLVERRAKEQFAAALELEAPAVIALSSEIAQKLSLPFLEEYGGSCQTLRLDAGVGVLEFRHGMSPSKFESKLDQLARVLTSQQ